jgi:uncharacterized repeat protein (TIGR01451 family)
MLVVLLVSLLPLHVRAMTPLQLAVEEAAVPPSQQIFDPAFSLVATLAPGTLGLPGEQITWTVNVLNVGTAAGTNLVVSDTLRPELLIGSIQTDRGSYTLKGQTVTLLVESLQPGESVQMHILTTIARAPEGGQIVNEATLTGVGPNGAVNENVLAEVSVPTGLPSTGYPPHDLPGDGEPPLWVFVLVGAVSIALTAWIVWRRGNRHLRLMRSR